MENFSQSEYENEHNRKTEEYVRFLDNIYWAAVNELLRHVMRHNINLDKPFQFSDYPQAKVAAEKIISELHAKMKSVITAGSRDQWLYACKKNNDFIKHVFDISKLPENVLRRYQGNNLTELNEFQNRSVNKLNLSERIWNNTQQAYTQIELAVDIALSEGNSAQELSRNVRKYLIDPEKLFRRVSDKYGNLKLSKAAAEYHPGRGKYRSSYKNAMRLARTEINMAYSQAEQLRIKELDFVVGFEIRLSNNHTLNGEPFKDICDELAGKYPKSFNWGAKWHPQCRCQRYTILMDPEEFNNDTLNELKAAINGTEYKKYSSKNTVRDVPDAFKEWIADNLERSQGWKSQPYFIKDNFVGGTLAGGLKI
jgi:hypothetical protein